MNRLKPVIQYEIYGALKDMLLFYGIEYIAIFCICFLINILTCEVGKLNGLEWNTIVFFIILGTKGYKDNFKMLMQNGYTRTYIYLGNALMFIVVAFLMASFDTIVLTGIKTYGTIVRANTLPGILYGDQGIVFPIMWLFSFYLLFGSIVYFIATLYAKADKKISTIMTIGIGTFVLCLMLFYQVFIPLEVKQMLQELWMNLLGFQGNGEIHYVYPVLTFLCISACLHALTYQKMKKIELTRLL